MIQQQIKKVKGVADIVFCIDISGSMESCIAGVKNHVSSFVRNLEVSNPNMIIDWQIGLLGYSSLNMYVLDLAKNLERFVQVVDNLKTEADEFTPGAIDYSISNFSWRTAANHFLVLFTDEALEGGHTTLYMDGGAGKFDSLLKKILDSHIRLFFFGEVDKYYKKLEQVPRCTVTFSDFNTIDFSQLMTGLGKTVSQACLPEGVIMTPTGMIYDLSGLNIIRL